MNMNITKSKFMEYIRCNRYPALNHIYKRKNMDDVLQDRYHDLLDSLEYDEELKEDFLEFDSTHLDVMKPYFDKVETVSANLVTKLFGGTTRYSLVYGEQKLFVRDYNNFLLQCYVDIYNHKDKEVNIIEAKATTTNKFLSMKYKEDGVTSYLFSKDDSGILHLNEIYDKELLSNVKYMKQRNKLFDRLNGAGVYVYDLAFQRFVIEEDIKDAKYYLGVLNHEYEFDGSYIDGEAIYNEDIACLIDLTIITKELQSMIKNDLDLVVDRILNDDESRVKLGEHCQLKKMRQCIFKDVCYDKFPKKNSLLMFTDKHHGFKDSGGDKHSYFELIEDGLLSMEDVPHDWLTRRNNQIQRDVAITKKPFFDQRKIRSAIESITYPIYHLDFESFPCPFPRFKGEKPYMQSLFQFSLHVEKVPGVCDKEEDHFEFLAKDHSDIRYQLVKQLCENIKDDGGSVMVYNQAFEKTRIKELAGFYPEFAEKLHNINTRLFDLMHIVKTNSELYRNLGFSDEEAKAVNFYHEDLSGSYSIKKVLPVFSELTYDGMEVGNGMAAVYAYASFPDLNEGELKEKRKALIEYCKQDTWAMVEILNELRKI